MNRGDCEGPRPAALSRDGNPLSDFPSVYSFEQLLTRFGCVSTDAGVDLVTNGKLARRRSV